MSRAPVPLRAPMMSLKEIPEAVLWEEGMLLAPQHFQQAARRQEDLLHFHAQLASPFHRGVLELAWDYAQLARGVLRVSKLEAVMTDGLAVRHHPASTAGAAMPDVDAAREVLLELDLAPHADAARRAPVRIWLTVPAHRGANEPWKGSLRRTVAIHGDQTVDENTGEEAEVRRARPALGLVAGAPPSAAYLALPVAEVSIVDETFRVTEYVPPRLRCTRDSEPFAWCNAIAVDARHRATAIAQRTGSREELLHPARLIAAALPPFEAVLWTECAHPFTLYHAFCGFAGALAGALPVPMPPKFPVYDHDDLAACFGAVHKFASETLRRVARVRESQRFDLFGTGFRLATLRGGWTRGEGLMVGLIASEGMTEADVVAWMKECIIASEGKIKDLRFQRVLGAARTRHIDASETGLTPGRDEVLFRVTPDPDFVEAGKPLVILHPHDPSGRLRPAAASLYTP